MCSGRGWVFGFAHQSLFTNHQSPLPPAPHHEAQVAGRCHGHPSGCLPFRQAQGPELAEGRQAMSLRSIPRAKTALPSHQLWNDGEREHMKSFFQNLFRQKPAEPSDQKDAEPAAAKPSPKPTSEQYRKGDVIGGKYEVHGTLGMGGFGVVLLATERATNRLRALKTFRDELLADASTREAFKREALLWVSLGEHPFILAARWAEVFSGRLFVAMDYVAPDAEGRVNLADHLRSAKPIRAERAVEWAIQFCLGMEHANAHGVRCHRDIKPANILIAQDGNLKVADFGLAAVQHRLTDRERLFVTRGQDGEFGFSMMQTEGKMMCGTPGYMPPEVYRGETTDVRSDIYTFGLVLWQMATGSPSPPFIGAFRGDILAFMRATYEQQISGRVPSVTGPLRVVIERCLQPTPSQRYSTFRELRGALEPIFQVLTGRPVTIPRTAEQTPSFWSDKGGSLFSLGRLDEAISCFDRALSIDPQDAMAWNNKGAALKTLGRHEEAIACFEKALAFDPQHAMAWHNKGVVLGKFERHEEAMTCYDKALAIDPSFPLCWNNKGLLHYLLGQREQALTCYDKALEIDPRHTETWINRGKTLGVLRRHEEAIACLDKVIAIDPGNATAWHFKGLALAILGRQEEGTACYEEALAIDPRHVLAWFHKAWAEDDMGRTAAAIRSYSKCLEFIPSLDAEQIAHVRRRLRELQNR